MSSTVELSLEKLPLLELNDGKTICGARACSLFIAKKLGLLGSNAYEEAKIHEILDASQDFSEGKNKICCASKLSLMFESCTDVIDVTRGLNSFIYLVIAAFYAIQLASTKEDKLKVSKNVVEVVTPKYMNLFNKLAEENPSGFMVGNQLSLADLHVFNIVCTCTCTCIVCTARHVTDNRLGLEKLVDKVSNIPQIRKWLEIRPKSVF